MLKFNFNRLLRDVRTSLLSLFLAFGTILTVVIGNIVIRYVYIPTGSDTLTNSSQSYCLRVIRGLFRCYRALAVHYHVPTQIDTYRSVVLWPNRGSPEVQIHQRSGRHTGQGSPPNAAACYHRLGQR